MLAKRLQLTLAIIKPHVMSNPVALQDIREIILDANFKIVKSDRRKLALVDAENFYDEHKGKFFYNRLVTFMTSNDNKAVGYVIVEIKTFINFKMLAKRLQLTLAIIKPHVMSNPVALQDIREIILDANFKIVKSDRRKLALVDAENFYDEHKGKFFYNRLVTFMTSNDNKAIGYVTVGIKTFINFKMLAKRLQLTLAIIKPHVMSNPVALQDIRELILDANFKIVKSDRRKLALVDAENFYDEHKGKFFYNRLVTFMTSGPVDLYILARADAIAEWRRLMGPTKVFKTQFYEPDSIRGRFGLSDTRNATHGSDSDESVRKEIKTFFPSFNVENWMREEEPRWRTGLGVTLNRDAFVHVLQS